MTSREERLQEERDRLRNEVVALRGHQEHAYEPQEVELGENRRWKCSRCGHETKAPVHAYFDPCKEPNDA